MFDMERDNTLIDSEKISDASLLESGIVIRHYKDDDYMAWHNISDVAFFLLREKLGLTPSYYLPLSETERKRLNNDSANRYVMLADGVPVAIGAVNKDWIHLLAVRPDLQRRGYGRIMAKYLNNLIITERNAEKVKIGVINGNPAKKLYENLGFREVRFSHSYVKYYKPDSRPGAPEDYANEEEILKDLRLYGRLREDTCF
jgi:GNAT superfamily N-acetyltransferase